MGVFVSAPNDNINYSHDIMVTQYAVCDASISIIIDGRGLSEEAIL